MDSKNIVSVAFQLTLFGSLYFGPLALSISAFRCVPSKLSAIKARK